MGSRTITRAARRPVFAAVALAVGLTLSKASDKILVVLPGQTFAPGVGVVGTPDPLVVRTPFRVALYVVDDNDYLNPAYEGRVVVPVVPAGQPGAGPPPARRLGTSISAIGAATSLPTGGALRLAFGGGSLQAVTLAPSASPQEVCDSIVNGVHALPEESFAVGTIDLHCEVTYSSLGVRYTLFLDDGTPVRAVATARAIATGGNWIAIDPSYGSAGALHLGAPEPTSDPMAGAEYYEPRPGPVTAVHQRFSRGMAFFETVIVSMDAVGPGRTIGVDQGGGPGALQVETTLVTVLPPSLHVVEATAKDGGGNGRIDRVRVTFSEPVELTTVQPSHFSLQVPGQAPIAGTELDSEPSTDLGFATDVIEVRFGTGLGKTDVQDVEVRYTAPSSGFLGSDSGTSVTSITLNPNTSPPLVDGAPPVLVSAFAQDIDGNGGLDRQVFFFSEPVAFSSARGTSISGFIPATDTTAFSVPVPFDLSLRTVGFVTQDLTVTVTDPSNPAATSITGVQAIADAITQAVRGHDPLTRPAYQNFTCTFTNGRYVLRAGVPLRFDVSTGVYVQNSSIPGGGPPPALKLGPSNGGVERPGSGTADPALSSSLVIRSQSGANLLLGKTAADMTITGSEISINLTNVPNSGTAQPTYIWKDLGDLGFIADRAPVPNLAANMNNAGLPPDFHPVTLLREASSSPSSTNPLELTRTVVAGDVILDASSSILPLNAQSPETVASFTWSQSGGAPVFIEQLAPGVAKVRPTDVTDTYVFTVEATFETFGVTSAFNPYTEADGSLSRDLVLRVLPGPPGRTVVLLPGQSLVPGADTTDEVTGGVAGIATEGSPYHVRVVTTDDFFNPVPAPPGAQVRLVTTDPDDIDTPFQPFTGSESDFTITPSHAATSMVPVIDDVVVGASEHGDVSRPYVVGRLWNVHPLPMLAAAPTLARFTWDADPRAVRWNIYRAPLGSLADHDGDGLPDSGYGACASASDPDPSDTYFEDAAMPPPGGGFLYAGTETIAVLGSNQEAGLGRTGSGMERPSVTPCP